MAGICLCNHAECVNAQNCQRFLEAQKEHECEIMNFPQICNDGNNYKWIWKLDENVEVKNTLKIEDVAKEETIQETIKEEKTAEVEEQTSEI